MHRFKHHGGGHRGRHGGGWGAMRGHRHGMHGGWGPPGADGGGACAAGTSARPCSSCSTRAR